MHRHCTREFLYPLLDLGVAWTYNGKQSDVVVKIDLAHRNDSAVHSSHNKDSSEQGHRRSYAQNSRPLVLFSVSRIRLHEGRRAVSGRHGCRDVVVVVGHKKGMSCGWFKNHF